MFGFGIFTYLKIAGALVVAGVLAFFIINYHHRGAVIEKQKIEIANLNLEKEVMEKKNKALEDFLAKKTVIKGKVVYVERQVDETVASGDIARILDMFHRLQHNQTQPPNHGGTGRVKPVPGRPANPGLN
jgi:DUF917 family protein